MIKRFEFVCGHPGLTSYIMERELPLYLKMLHDDGHPLSGRVLVTLGMIVEGSCQLLVHPDDAKKFTDALKYADFVVLWLGLGEMTTSPVSQAARDAAACGAEQFFAMAETITEVLKH